MPAYRYHAIDKDGKRVTGTVRADDVTHLYALLQSRDLFCVSYAEKAESKSGLKKLDFRTLSLTSRQLSAMLSAGVSLVSALDMLSLTATKAMSKQLFQDLSSRVKRGHSLSMALGQSVALFPALYVHLVKSGEESGTLDQVMARLAVHYEKEQKMKNKVTSAMMYPLILLVVTLVVVVGLMTFVLPTFFSMFEGIELPWNTRFLIWLSEFLLAYGWILALGIVALIPVVRLWVKKPEVAYVVDHWKLKYPVFGKLQTVILTSRFARTFASLFGNGIAVVQSLEITNDVIGNQFIRVKLQNAIERIKQGDSLSKSLHEIFVFDELLHSMLYVGEESGNLEGILHTVADYYDEEADNAITKMIALLEPIMIVILALIIGFVLISVIVPIYNSFSLVA